MNYFNVNAGVSPVNFVNPLLLNYTPKTEIQEESDSFLPLLYDDEKQIVVYNMRTIGTRSLKTESTRKKTGKTGYCTASDRKNAIDDSKSVK
jgi:hypothetical protein